MDREINHKTSILVIDDEEVVRHSHLRVLSGPGCTVATADGGMTGLQALEASAYDLVLLDLRMPGMDGLEVLRQIKSRWPECEVVVVTGYPTIESAKEAVRLGAYDYLAKPVEPDRVIDTAHSAVRQKRWTMQREALAA